MFRRAPGSLLHQAQQLCDNAARNATREGLQALAGSGLPARSYTQPLLQTRGAASSSGPSSASGATRPGTSAAAATAAASTSGSAETPLSFLARQQRTLDAMPLYPKMLGFAGAIPFLTLTPNFVAAAGFPGWVDYFAQMQLVYGGSVVTFLGAVHWGMAMNSTALAGTAARASKAASALSERFVWSVVPSLAVVPALLLEPAQGSFCIAMLLAICYISDASYFRNGHLPSWYMSLRGYLTLLAMLGMLSTTWHYFQRDVAKAKQMMEQEDAKRLARLEARAAGAGSVGMRRDGGGEEPSPVMAAAAASSAAAPADVAEVSEPAPVAAAPPAKSGRKWWRLW